MNVNMYTGICTNKLCIAPVCLFVQTARRNEKKPNANEMNQTEKYRCRTDNSSCFSVFVFFSLLLLLPSSFFRLKRRFFLYWTLSVCLLLFSLFCNFFSVFFSRLLRQKIWLTQYSKSLQCAVTVYFFVVRSFFFVLTSHTHSSTKILNYFSHTKRIKIFVIILNFFKTYFLRMISWSLSILMDFNIMFIY